MKNTSQNIFLLDSQETIGQIGDLSRSHRQILISEYEYFKLNWEVCYWKSLYQNAKNEENQLKQELLEKEGKISDLTKRLFGKSSEKRSSGKNENQSKPPKSPRHRGQQPGSKGHGSTLRPNIKEKREYISLPVEKRVCPKCGKVYAPNGTEDSAVFEVSVAAHKRIIKRRNYKQDCNCEGLASFITAPPVPKVIPKSQYGISIWEMVLLNKFLYSQPTKRLLDSFEELGLPISQGTITGGLQKMENLFKPIYEALFQQQMSEDRFHNDESGWKVFESIEGKVGHRWWLWLCRSASVIYFLIAPGRGTDVPLEHFKQIQSGKIIVVCDRFSVYKSLAKQLSFIILAFCWAHVRRDFLDAAGKHPQLAEWALMWVEMIGELYHINNLRFESFDQKLPLQCQSDEFEKHHANLVDKMNQMAIKRDDFLNQDFDDVSVLWEIKRKILISLKNHWEGLSVFVTYPDVPMDNNPAEQSIRNPVTGRKNYYGSGSVWSSLLAAMMFSILQTLKLWDLNCHHWLRLYLTACANNAGQAPGDLSSFLPWKMDQDRRHQLAKPPPDSS